MDNRQINCLDTGEVVVGYENYMKTNHWIQIRSSIINQSSKCTACGSTEKLHLHHRHYKNIGNETIADFEILCKRCHNRIHYLKREKKQFKNTSVTKMTDIVINGVKSGDHSTFKPKKKKPKKKKPKKTRKNKFKRNNYGIRDYSSKKSFYGPR